MSIAYIQRGVRPALTVRLVPCCPSRMNRGGALESYERSLAIYKELVNVRNRETREAAKIEMQRVRKIIVALVHEPPK